MIMQRKCCAHCPGSVTRTGEPSREHACDAPDLPAGDTLEPPPSTCFDRFATARKFHKENLEHQPLPDRVDDAIFTASRRAVDHPFMCQAVKRCQKIVPRRQSLNRKKELSRVHRYAPALGCKKPTTYMDLAICWETPTDAAYEPRRPVHIDGSYGGPAPAIFTLVQHSGSPVDVKEGCIPRQRTRGGAAAAEHDEEACDCARHRPCDRCSQSADNQATDDNEDLCKNFNSIRITAERGGCDGGGGGDSPASIGARARDRRAQFNRHCYACDLKDSPARSSGRTARSTRSASSLQKNGCAVVARKNNGLTGIRNGASRPRTPYARRSFCIDTLAPPFSVVAGCRDADYPEHWRLTSIYQQSYRHPRQTRACRTILNYDHGGC